MNRPLRQCVLPLGLALGVVVSGHAQRHVPTGAPAEQTEITIEGLAPAGDPNRESSARQDAMRKAIEQVAGRQVRNLAIASYHQLLASYTLAQTSGFVEEAGPLGPGEESGGVFLRRYRVRVRAGEVNRDLVEQGIDVDFLYEVVARPRIALALRDEWRPPTDPTGWQSDGRATSNQEINRYFKQKHTGFVFKDLELLRESLDQKVDYVREAGRARFDVLILGQTRAVPRTVRLASESNPWLARPADPAGGTLRHNYDAELEWRVVNVATAETLFTISGRFTTPADAPNQELATPDAAMLWAKERLLTDKVPELFRNLLAYWNRQAFSQDYELVFQTAGTVAPDELAALLREKAGFAGEELRLVSASGGEVIFAGHSPQGGTDVAGRIGAAVAPRFIVQEIRPGRIMLARGETAGTGVRVEVSGIAFGAAANLERNLAAAPGVLGVRRLEFAQGRVVLIVSTARAPADLALNIEKIGGPDLRIRTVSGDRIEAVVREEAQ